MSQHFDSDPFWPAALLAGSLPTGHLEQRQQQPAVRGIPIDVVETADKFQIKADIPGVTKQDIKLNVDGDVLSLSVQKAEQKQDKKEEANWKFHRTERSSTFVRRSLRLPEHADLSKISAKYTDGVLAVDVPKSTEERTRTVQIQ
jgi:HSP20 family protein